MHLHGRIIIIAFVVFHILRNCWERKGNYDLHKVWIVFLELKVFLDADGENGQKKLVQAYLFALGESSALLCWHYNSVHSLKLPSHVILIFLNTVLVRFQFIVVLKEPDKLNWKAQINSNPLQHCNVLEVFEGKVSFGVLVRHGKCTLRYRGPVVKQMWATEDKSHFFLWVIGKQIIMLRACCLVVTPTSPEFYCEIEQLLLTVSILDDTNIVSPCLLEFLTLEMPQKVLAKHLFDADEGPKLWNHPVQ